MKSKHDADTTRCLLETLAGISNEGRRWKLAHKTFHHAVREAHERTQARRDYLARLFALAEDGKIAVVHSGRDCDGVAYSGCVTIVDATVKAVQEHIDHQTKWADGPMWFDLDRPSAAAAIEYQSRDLTLEAFEDGHSHVISEVRFEGH